MVEFIGHGTEASGEKRRLRWYRASIADVVVTKHHSYSIVIQASNQREIIRHIRLPTTK
jgi:hypothetical protein